VRALLDVNVLIALLDADHTLHERAIHWFARHAPEGWASCAITQNGCVRIMSNPAYPNALPAPIVMARLSAACRHEFHEFWPCEISVLTAESIDATRIHGPRQLTDIYLLALAVGRQGRLVTFDAGIPLAAVRGAGQQHCIAL
jgi:toxin-antitoxin system PIN domain toxin